MPDHEAQIANLGPERSRIVTEYVGMAGSGHTKIELACGTSLVQLHLEMLPEGVYLATSDEVQGLIAQGRTIQETIVIARDVARQLIEAHTGN